MKTPAVTRIALLAPFEGRYRDVGYDALYAGRLAFADVRNSRYEFLPIDDGGTVERAAERARALTLDPSVTAVVVLGYNAAHADTLSAFADLPVLVVGNWTTVAPSGRVYVVSNPEITTYLSAPPDVEITEAARLDTPVVGGEVFALPGYSDLHGELEGIVVVSSGALPDANFVERYRSSDPFAPAPGLLTTLTYDAIRFLLQANQPDRESLNRAISQMTVEGVNGTIRLENGYWANAPIHFYSYEDGQLTAADHVVEQR